MFQLGWESGGICNTIWLDLAPIWRLPKARFALMMLRILFTSLEQVQRE